MRLQRTASSSPIHASTLLHGLQAVPCLQRRAKAQACSRPSREVKYSLYALTDAIVIIIIIIIIIITLTIRLDCAVPQDEAPEAYELLRSMTPVPFALGEEFASKWQFIPYVEKGLANFCRVDIINVGGFTETMKVRRAAQSTLFCAQSLACLQ